MFHYLTRGQLEAAVTADGVDMTRAFFIKNSRIRLQTLQTKFMQARLPMQVAVLAHETEGALKVFSDLLNI